MQFHRKIRIRKASFVKTPISNSKKLKEETSELFVYREKFWAVEVNPVRNSIGASNPY